MEFQEQNTKANLRYGYLNSCPVSSHLNGFMLLKLEGMSGSQPSAAEEKQVYLHSYLGT